ncbi:MAG: hypothetical protein Q7U38_14250 [Methylobacter sp.]|nr:hypothetical protein [Methylobacter sp.]MDP2169659.1 hypothetical protein [Rhodocyclaceae bacterium]MDP2429028.1 hypothetical protein [Methylobacter sp.]MDP3056529.1 hypothetical protein [Methylobacter sp.]MDP3362018.1 hypothetical protein [Methylobacter sp.]
MSLDLFKAKREELGTKGLADALGITGSAVRMVCTGHYPNPTPILNLFARRYINIVRCPYIDEDIGRDVCRNRSTAPRPFGGASKLTWWEACQLCSQKGE